MSHRMGTDIIDIKIICDDRASSIENKVRDAIKEGWQYESVMNGCPNSCPSSCILLVNRRLPTHWKTWLIRRIIYRHREIWRIVKKRNGRSEKVTILSTINYIE